MISYDATPASARAIHDTIPLLKRAKETTVLIVESQKQKERFFIASRCIHYLKDVNSSR